MPEKILSFIPKERMICLYTSNEEIEKRFFFREDHKMILDVIKLTADPEKAIKNGNEVMMTFSNTIKNACVKNGIKTLTFTTSKQ